MPTQELGADHKPFYMSTLTSPLCGPECSGEGRNRASWCRLGSSTRSIGWKHEGRMELGPQSSSRPHHCQSPWAASISTNGTGHPQRAPRAPSFQVQRWNPQEPPESVLGRGLP